MKRSVKIVVAALFISPFIAPILAWAAQEVLMLGVDSSGNERQILVDTSGRPITLTAGAAAHGACVNSAISVGTSATNVPASAMAGRRSITICSSTAGTLTCEFDGAAAVAATGVELGDLDCVSVSLADSVNASCIGSVTIDTRALECP